MSDMSDRLSQLYGLQTRFNVGLALEYLSTICGSEVDANSVKWNDDQVFTVQVTPAQYSHATSYIYRYEGEPKVEHAPSLCVYTWYPKHHVRGGVLTLRQHTLRDTVNYTIQLTVRK